MDGSGKGTGSFRLGVLVNEILGNWDMELMERVGAEGFTGKVTGTGLGGTDWRMGSGFFTAGVTGGEDAA